MSKCIANCNQEALKSSSVCQFHLTHPSHVLHPEESADQIQEEAETTNHPTPEELATQLYKLSQSHKAREGGAVMRKEYSGLKVLLRAYDDYVYSLYQVPFQKADGEIVMTKNVTFQGFMEYLRGKAAEL